MQNMLYILPRGLAIGMLISAPMGPIGMLVIQRTLSKGRWPAFFTGLGASLSDLIYCLLTGLGISFITDLIETHQFMLQIVGSVVLGCFGLVLFKKNPTRALKSHDTQPSNNYWKDFGSGFLLTFSNPLILFFIIGLFARFNFILPEFGVHHYVWAYFTIAAGALLWWWFVTMLVSKLRSRFNVRSLWLINRIIGGLLVLMSLVGIAFSLNDHF